MKLKLDKNEAIINIKINKEKVQKFNVKGDENSLITCFVAILKYLVKHDYITFNQLSSALSIIFKDEIKKDIEYELSQQKQLHEELSKLFKMIDIENL